MNRSRCLAGFALIGGLALVPLDASAQSSTLPRKQFTASAIANPRIAKRLSMPVYFTLPRTAWGDIGKEFPTTDVLVDFKHPDDKTGDLGLRVVETKRSGMAERLGASGLLKTGDLILSFWPDWGGAGAYPNVQMGVSHVGIAYIKDGVLHNLDNPLNAEYNSPSDLRSANYKEVYQMHVVRPRGLSDAQRANLQAWIQAFANNSSKIYPSRMSFNSDYNAPKYKAGQPVTFVKSIAQAALGQDSGAPVAMYCSEFAWSVLSLRDCDPAKSAEQFKRTGIPACVREPMRPMLATGDYMMTRGRSSYAGLADGPLMVIDALKLQGSARQSMIDNVFSVSKPDGLKKMSSGHRETAKVMQPKFEALKGYYSGVTGTSAQKQQASAIGAGFAQEIPQNYSPTSYLINTLLPKDNPNRTMDYVATIIVN